MKKILYIGWIGFGNLGDDLMVRLFQHRLQSMDQGRNIEIIPSSPGLNIREVAPYDAVVLGGGSLLHPGYIDVMHNALTNGKPVHVWGSGFDWLEQHAVDALGQKHPEDVSNLWAASSKKQMIEVSHHARSFGVRGPLSSKLLQEWQAPNHRIIGDPALLLSSEKPKKPTLTLDPKKKWIAVNWGTAYNRIYGQDENLVAQRLAAAARKLVDQGYSILLYPMWGPDAKPCEQLKSLIDRDDRILFIRKVPHETELMGWLKQCEWSVNLKLHASVLSAAAGVPFVALGYRFKVFDFAASMDWSAFVLATDDPELDQHVISVSEQILHKKKKLTSILQRHNAVYHQRITDNLKMILKAGSE
ncbi:MAG: polysaccharide pyruvyl transferase family protein [Paenibacillaceae bacterium]|nr:polysaccharide pyruvyl transferase family protein [Paenibacillaceae bacterium]